MAFASQQTVHVLASPDELKMLESAFEEDSSNRMCKWNSLHISIWFSLLLASDEEKLYTLKRMLIDYRQATFESTLKKAEARDSYERRIKRQYFHVKSLGQNDLATWRVYLDFELIHGDLVCLGG